MKIDLAKTCLAVLLGIVIGVVFMILIRPREVKAQGGTVFVDSVSVPSVGATSTVNIKGSRIIGFVCPSGGACVIASQQARQVSAINRKTAEVQYQPEHGR